MSNNSYRAIIEPFVFEYRARNYAYWLHHVSAEPIIIDGSAPDGTKYCIKIVASMDGKPDGNIRVIISLHDVSPQGFVPVTCSFIIAPDGSFVRM